MMFAACPPAADFKASSPEALLQKTDKTGTQIWPPIPAMNLGTRYVTNMIMNSARPTQLRMNIHRTLTPRVGPANLTAKRIWCQMWELTTRLKTKCLPSHHLPIRILVESIFTRLHACMHACVLLAPYPALRALHLNNQSTSLPPSANKTGCMFGEYRFRAGHVGAFRPA